MCVLCSVQPVDVSHFTTKHIKSVIVPELGSSIGFTLTQRYNDISHSNSGTVTQVIFRTMHMTHLHCILIPHTYSLMLQCYQEHGWSQVFNR